MSSSTTTKILAILLLIAIIALATLSYKYDQLSKQTYATDCPTDLNQLSTSPIVCGNYTLITPIGWQEIGGNTTVWINNLHFLSAGCKYTIQTLKPKITQRTLSVTAYNTSNATTEIFDLPAYMTNSTGKHFQFLEYIVSCGLH